MHSQHPIFVAADSEGRRPEHRSDSTPVAPPDRILFGGRTTNDARLRMPEQTRAERRRENKSAFFENECVRTSKQERTSRLLPPDRSEIKRIKRPSPIGRKSRAPSARPLFIPSDVEQKSGEEAEKGGELEEQTAYVRFRSKMRVATTERGATLNKRTKPTPSANLNKSQPNFGLLDGGGELRRPIGCGAEEHQ